MKKLGFLTLMIAFVAGLSMGCRKKEDTIAQITVKNAAGARIEGASVRLYPKPSCTGCANNSLLWEFTAETNSNGVASFNFNDIYQLGQAGVVVANIDASYNGSSGTGVIKVDQEVISEATVFL